MCRHIIINPGNRSFLVVLAWYVTMSLTRLVLPDNLKKSRSATASAYSAQPPLDPRCILDWSVRTDPPHCCDHLITRIRIRGARPGLIVASSVRQKRKSHSSPQIVNPSCRQNLIEEIDAAMIELKTINLKESRATGNTFPPNQRTPPDVYVQ